MHLNPGDPGVELLFSLTSEDEASLGFVEVPLPSCPVEEFQICIVLQRITSRPLISRRSLFLLLIDFIVQSSCTSSEVLLFSQSRQLGVHLYYSMALHNLGNWSSRVLPTAEHTVGLASGPHRLDSLIARPMVRVDQTNCRSDGTFEVALKVA